MKRRPRHKKGSEVRLGAVFRAFMFCLLIAAAAVGYVRQSHENDRLRIQTKHLQDAQAKLELSNKLKKAEYDRLISPAELKARVLHLGLDLATAQAEQKYTLVMPAPEPPMLAQQLRSVLTADRIPE